MREILFRGKRIDNGEWVEGIYYKRTHDYGDISEKHYIITSTESLQYDQALEYEEIAPETVGQYTGLTDKNGKKIFEGDLLDGFSYPYLYEEYHNYFAEVVWFDNTPAFGLYTHKYPTSTVRGCSDGNCDYIEDFDSSDWEVIGNIYDNPELLKGE